MKKNYTLYGTKTTNWIAEFTHEEMTSAGYTSPQDYGQDCLCDWERSDIREGQPPIEIYDVDYEFIEGEK